MRAEVTTPCEVLDLVNSDSQICKCASELNPGSKFKMHTPRFYLFMDMCAPIDSDYKSLR